LRGFGFLSDAAGIITTRPLNLDVAYTRARFTDFDPGGNFIPGEPIGGVADRHVHPAEALAVRLMLAGRF
jgi:hypothetical protein